MLTIRLVATVSIDPEAEDTLKTQIEGDADSVQELAAACAVTAALQLVFHSNFMDLLTADGQSRLRTESSHLFKATLEDSNISLASQGNLVQ